MINGDIAFLHIPKTGGTALRNALIEGFPNACHLMDYGEKPTITSEIIRKHKYDQRNVRSIRDTVSGQIILSGHFCAEDYLDLFHPGQFVTFLREPIERLLSDYKHFVRHSNFRKSVMEFARIPSQQNKQSRLLKGLDLQEIGFLGMMERYDSDISCLSNIIGVDLRPRFVNAAPKNQKIDLDEDLMSKLQQLNADDIRLYQQALHLHKTNSGIQQAWEPKK